MTPRKIRIRGIRQKIPPGYVIGSGSGKGQPVLIPVSQLAQQIAAQTGSGGGSGGGGGGSQPLGFRLVGGTPGRKPNDGEELFNVLMRAGDSLPLNLTGSQLACETAPAANWTLTLKRVVAGTPTAAGTGTIASGQTSGTFAFAASVTFGDGDLWTATAQSPPDAALSGVAFSFAGTRTQ